MSGLFPLPLQYANLVQKPLNVIKVAHKAGNYVLTSEFYSLAGVAEFLLVRNKAKFIQSNVLNNGYGKAAVF